ncbi:DNA packaging protein UL33 [Bovine alphaherpesvirus 5]|uniref:UL33 capsid packaging protein n=1 Tax=Bovine alphaherpesvirus 5 TaxID=35244 RepID=Q6X245_9ALPH|nr:UL33 capsid packaging protein [Bovine alphaherpesvirus 5]AAR86128.1 UL33 capsid packaging protein [Bovine alphaherpesvirus 5]AQM74739.1 DNA packaging protein UL33 [Bovine alphaherpesvirus 5]ART33250.1 DNA packaging protein UL33 [Bovine alphaherpesvirus 5]QVY10558.1 UL33 capsid packaging protein [Bovine alphaherpesvirus 5]UHJ15450.1 UL33 capsid packaging protein [Bovine alphaherpesvirus 5]
MRLRELIPPEALATEDVAELERRYLRGGDTDADVEIWFEDVAPRELEVLLPTTDAKVNYLAFTARLASALAHGPGGRPACSHTRALEARKERFATVINKFLDLHQILHDA